MNKKEILDLIESELTKLRQRRRVLFENLEAAEKEPTTWVVGTGGKEIVVWRNEQAAMAGKFSISLAHATMYTSKADATRFASKITDGNGCKGTVYTKIEACEIDLKAVVYCIDMMVARAKEVV